MDLNAETVRKENQEFLFQEGISKLPNLPLTQSPGLRRVRRVFDIASRMRGLKAGGAEGKGDDKGESARGKRHEVPTSDE